MRFDDERPATVDVATGRVVEAVTSTSVDGVTIRRGAFYAADDPFVAAHAALFAPWSPAALQRRWWQRRGTEPATVTVNVARTRIENR